MIIAEQIRPVAPPPAVRAVVYALVGVFVAVLVVSLVVDAVRERRAQRLTVLAVRVITIVQTVPDGSFSADGRRQRDAAVDWLTTVSFEAMHRRPGWHRSQTAVFMLLRLLPDELFRGVERTQLEQALRHLDNDPRTIRWGRDAKFDAKFATALLEELVSRLYYRVGGPTRRMVVPSR